MKNKTLRILLIISVILNLYLFGVAVNYVVVADDYCNTVNLGIKTNNIAIDLINTLKQDLNLSSENIQKLERIDCPITKYEGGKI